MHSWPGSRHTRALRHLEEAPVPRPCRPEIRICPTQALLYNSQGGREEAGDSEVTPSSVLGQDSKCSSEELPLSVHDWQPWPRSASKCMPVPGISVALMTTEPEKMIQFANHRWLLKKLRFDAVSTSCDARLFSEIPLRAHIFGHGAQASPRAQICRRRDIDEGVLDMLALRGGSKWPLMGWNSGALLLLCSDRLSLQRQG